jgi:selenide, water dikinase
VYRLRDDLAIIQTVDFFTPIVDDPYLFGQIAATNALSDVYAMGGVPVCAMNIAGFPIQEMDISILHDILRGGLDKLHEASVTLVGGHSVEDKELKYGLSVTGTIHPDRILTNQGAKAGDRLIITKPIGTGIINTAIKAELANDNTVALVSSSMAELNRSAADAISDFDVHACTDVTGFGLIGHACEMIDGCAIGLTINAESVPVFPAALEFSAMGLNPAGLYRNRDYRIAMVDLESDVPEPWADLLFDPQTSGGLLFAVAAEDATPVLRRLHEAGIGVAAVIGEFFETPTGRIQIVR